MRAKPERELKAIFGEKMRQENDCFATRYLLRISRIILVYYFKCYNLIGYSTRYLYSSIHSEKENNRYDGDSKTIPNLYPFLPFFVTFNLDRE